jgi:hypothetical protein
MPKADYQQFIGAASTAMGDGTKLNFRVRLLRTAELSTFDSNGDSACRCRWPVPAARGELTATRAEYVAFSERQLAVYCTGVAWYLVSAKVACRRGSGVTACMASLRSRGAERVLAGEAGGRIRRR